MKDCGAKIIDLSENQCWNNKCEVLSPSGHPTYIDDNHFASSYSKYWLSAVDSVIDF